VREDAVLRVTAVAPVIELQRRVVRVVLELETARLVGVARELRGRAEERADERRAETVRAARGVRVEGSASHGAGDEAANLAGDARRHQEAVIRVSRLARARALPRERRERSAVERDEQERP